MCQRFGAVCLCVKNLEISVSTAVVLAFYDTGPRGNIKGCYFADLNFNLYKTIIYDNKARFIDWQNITPIERTKTKSFELMQFLAVFYL